MSDESRRLILFIITHHYLLRSHSSPRFMVSDGAGTSDKRMMSDEVNESGGGTHHSLLFTHH